MISKNFLRICKWGVAIMKFSIYTYFEWDNDTNRLKLKKNMYFVFNQCYLMCYCYFIGVVSAYHAVGYISAEPENGVNEIFDVEFKPRDEGTAILNGLVHIMYCLAATGVIGNLGVNLLTKRHEFVGLMNMSIENDLRYQEMYKEYLERHPDNKRFHKEMDIILLIIAVGTTLVPVIFAFLIFQDFYPEHQILLRYFEIKVEYKWKFAPLLIYFIYMLLQACDILFIMDVTGGMHLICCPIWLRLMHPERVEIEEGSPNFRCHIECSLNEAQILRFYKEQQLRQEAYNSIFGNQLVTGHHSSFLYISAFGLFICIRHWRFILEPGYSMAPLAVLLCCFAEYMEVRLVERVAIKSGEYLQALGILARGEGKRLVRLQKGLKSYRILQPQHAYPYYRLTKENYLLYVNSIVDILVSILVI
ncbi:unnamed protein product [Orchesella dallaii]|uniref:Odorant receptor n=1 Tax=Orchesella dallaii TaxID=48710 RepID=A0ABP1RJT8_9HEXA